MPKASSVPGKKQVILLSLVTLMVLAADQLTKVWVRSNLSLGESIPETGWLRLTRVGNTGSAFGLFQGQSFILTIIGIVGVVALFLCIVLLYRQFPFLNNTPGRLTLSFILGGTLGNLIDRLRFGYVTDFIDVGFWPAFNIADSAIVVGGIIFAYLLISSARTRMQQVVSR